MCGSVHGMYVLGEETPFQPVISASDGAELLPRGVAT